MCSVFITRVKKNPSKTKGEYNGNLKATMLTKRFLKRIMSKTTLKLEDFSSLNLKRNVMPLLFLPLFLEMG